MNDFSTSAILGKAYDRGEKGIPFHRIVYSDGRVWAGSSYDAKRKKLYKKEGIEIDTKDRIVNFGRVCLDY